MGPAAGHDQLPGRHPAAGLHAAQPQTTHQPRGRSPSPPSTGLGRAPALLALPCAPTRHHHHERTLMKGPPVAPAAPRCQPIQRRYRPRNRARGHEEILMTTARRAACIAPQAVIPSRPQAAPRQWWRPGPAEAPRGRNGLRRPSQRGAAVTVGDEMQRVIRSGAQRVVAAGRACGSGRPAPRFSWAWRGPRPASFSVTATP
jgi:hypothetical protein